MAKASLNYISFTGTTTGTTTENKEVTVFLPKRRIRQLTFINSELSIQLFLGDEHLPTVAVQYTLLTKEFEDLKNKVEHSFI